MTTATAKKPTAKETLIAKIVDHEDSSYKVETCDKMSMRELKEVWAELNEVPPEVGDDGKLVIPEQPAMPQPPAKTDKGSRGPSKRDTLYAAFDAAHAEGSDLKAAARAASPETSEGVISSYLCYWRKDMGVASTRSFGNAAVKMTNGEKALKALIKIFGEKFDLVAATEEIKAAIDAEEAAEMAEAQQAQQNETVETESETESESAE